MSTMAIDESAQKIVARLERKEAERAGVPLSLARRQLARRLDVAPGTLENIRRGRTKGVRGWILARLTAAIVHELQREIAALTHELETVRRSSLAFGLDEIEEVEASLAATRQALRQGAGE